jgi:hypothetical protein
VKSETSVLLGTTVVMVRYESVSWRRRLNQDPSLTGVFEGRPRRFSASILRVNAGQPA